LGKSFLVFFGHSLHALQAASKMDWGSEHFHGRCLEWFGAGKWLRGKVIPQSQRAGDLTSLIVTDNNHFPGQVLTRKFKFCFRRVHKLTDNLPPLSIRFVNLQRLTINDHLPFPTTVWSSETICEFSTNSSCDTLKPPHSVNTSVFFSSTVGGTSCVKKLCLATWLLRGEYR
jgi:hypothetical protein